MNPAADTQTAGSNPGCDISYYIKVRFGEARILFVPIMRPALNNLNSVIFNTVNYTVAIVYMSAPVSPQISGKRFRFANSGITVPVNIF